MLITIVGTKGAQWKSTLANAIAHEFGFWIITNDIDSSVDEYFSEKQVMKVRNDASIPEIPKNIWAIFDGKAGIDEPVVRDAVTKADHVLIPCVFGVEEVKRAKRAIRELEKLNKKITIIANTVANDEAKELSAIFEAEFSYPIITIRRSRYIGELLFTAESLTDKAKKGGLTGYFMRDVLEQFETLYKALWLR